MDFVDTLAKIRTGSCSTGDLQSLEAACSRPLDLSDGILPTVVCLCTLPRQAPCSKKFRECGAYWAGRRCRDKVYLCLLVGVPVGKVWY